jgi:hypothetical protein
MRPAAAQRIEIEDALQKLRRIRDVWNRMEAVVAAAAATMAE